MPTLNPDVAFQLPPARSVSAVVTEAFPEDWLVRLIQIAQENLELNPPVDLATRMRRHVGTDSTYAMKEQLMDALKAIYPVMMDANTSKDTKAAIAFKLAERAEHCTPGFHDGVNSIVEGFERPESMDALLYRIRHDIVSKTANQTTDEVHANNRFFTIAQTAGFGVRTLNPNDVYTGGIPDQTIIDKLDEAFSRDFRLFFILSAMNDQINSELLTLGYKNNQDEHDPEVMTKCEAWLTTLFKDSPAVIKQLEAKQHYDVLNNTYDQRVSEYMSAKRTRIHQLSSSLASAPLQSGFVDLIIMNKIPPALVKRYDTFLSHLDPNVKNDLAQLQQDTAQFFKELKPLVTQMNEEKAHSTSPFLSIESDSMHLNWKHIGQAIWDELTRKHYVILTEKETLALGSLLDNSQPFHSLSCEELELNGSEMLTLLKMNTVGDEKKKGLLDWYIREGKNTLDKLKNLAPIQELGKHDELIRSVLMEHESIINHWITILRQDWLIKLRTPGFQYDSIPVYLSHDKEFMLAVVQQNSFALGYASNALKGDRAFILAVVQQNGFVLCSASAALKRDREIVLAAVQQNGDALSSASAALQGDREIVLAAVRQNGYALRYASAALKGDREIVLAAVKQNDVACDFVSVELLIGDKELMHAAMKRLKGGASELSELSHNKQFMLAALKVDGGMVLQYASDALKQDVEIRVAAMKQQLMKKLDPVEIMASMKKALFGIKPQYLTEEQLSKIDEHLQVLDNEAKTSNNDTVKSIKKEHMAALGELKTLCQTMDVSSALQQIEADDRFKHVKMGSRTYQLMNEIKDECVNTRLQK